MSAVTVAKAAINPPNEWGLHEGANSTGIFIVDRVLNTLTLASLSPPGLSTFTYGSSGTYLPGEGEISHGYSCI